MRDSAKHGTDGHRMVYRGCGLYFGPMKFLWIYVLVVCQMILTVAHMGASQN